MKDFTLGIIGCGNMGGAIARGIREKGILSGDKVFLYDVDGGRVSSLAAETGFQMGELSQMVRGCDFLLLAVKPQDFDSLLKNIKADIVSQTIISVMAGVRIEKIIEKIGKNIPIARAMPNMAASVKEAVTCITFNSLVKDKSGINELFTGIGEVLEIEEGLMDAVTAISGSGPAYLFYLADAMIEAAKSEGISESEAKELVAQTLYGSSLLLKESSSSAGELIKKVASKGGTTEAALGVFDEKGLKSIIKEAVKKARERSSELSEG